MWTFLSVAVHTTGVNIDGVLANCASICVVLGIFGALVVRILKASIGDQINSVIDKKVSPTLENIQHQVNGQDIRLARLEGVETGKRYAIDAAGVSTRSAD